MSYSASSAAAADQQYGLPPGTLEALAGAESSYGANTNNGVPGGGVGPWQETAGFQTTYGITDPNNASQAGSAFSQLLQSVGGNLSAAYVAWNQGLAGQASGATANYSTNGPVGTFLATQGYNETGPNVATVSNSGLPVGQAGNVYANANPLNGAAQWLYGSTGAPMTSGPNASVASDTASSVAAYTSGWWAVIEQGLVVLIGLALLLVALAYMLSQSKTVQVAASTIARATA